MKMRLTIGLAVVGLSSFGEVKPLAEPWLKAGETLACFGDSITAGKHYFPILNEALAAKGVKAVNVGLSGDKTPMALTRIGDVAAAKPDAVMIFFGANDSVIGRGRWADEPTVDPITYRDNIIWMVHWLRLKTNVRKFSIIAPTGCCEGAEIEEFGEAWRPYARAAREACDRTGAVLVPLDVAFDRERARTQKDPADLCLTADGVHYNPRGRQLAADVMLQSWKMK